MGIPIGKLQLYTACAGVPPRALLPLLLDFGTNNRELLNDPLYLGLRQTRPTIQETEPFVDEFHVQVCLKLINQSLKLINQSLKLINQSPEPAY
jgi:malic enzyme